MSPEVQTAVDGLLITAAGAGTTLIGWLMMWFRSMRKSMREYDKKRTLKDSILKLLDLPDKHDRLDTYVRDDIKGKLDYLYEEREAFIEDSLNVLFRCNERGENITVSAGYHRLTESKVGDLQDRKWEAIIHPDNRIQFLEHVEICLNTGAHFAMESELRSLHGESIGRWMVVMDRRGSNGSAVWEGRMRPVDKISTDNARKQELDVRFAPKFRSEM